MNQKVKKIVYSLIGPIAVFLLMEVLCYNSVELHLLGRSADVTNFIRSLTMIFCTAMALSCNITSGRMDFSIGAIMVTGPIIGGNIAMQLGLGGVGVLVLSIVVSVMLSFVVGVLYVVTRISPIVLSLGMALIYEALGYKMFDSTGLRLSNTQEVIILSDKLFLTIVLLLVLVLMIYIFQKTSFGYHYRALMVGQATAVNAGVNEKVNAVLCYAISGGLISIAGVVKAAYQGTMAPDLGLASVGTIFSSMLPVFLGGFLGKFSNDTLGIFLGSIMLAMVNLGMSTIGVSQTKQTLISACILLVFLVFSNNTQVILERTIRKERKALALKEQE